MARIAIIIPACNEEACLDRVLRELLAGVDREKFVVAVGVNDSTDRTAEIARGHGVIVGQTEARGYGHGCQAAIEAVRKAVPEVRAYLFMAGDGANHPADLGGLVEAYENGAALVLGMRTGQWRNWSVMTPPHVVANLVLGAWCGLLTGRWFADLAPFRLIERQLFERLALREMTVGWTIEAQIGAALLAAEICKVPVRERRRLAGRQKVSGVTWRRSLTIGLRILAAGWRARRRFAHRPAPRGLPGSEILPSQS